MAIYKIPKFLFEKDRKKQHPIKHTFLNSTENLQEIDLKKLVFSYKMIWDSNDISNDQFYVELNKYIDGLNDLGINVFMSETHWGLNAVSSIVVDGKVVTKEYKYYFFIDELQYYKFCFRNGCSESAIDVAFSNAMNTVKNSVIGDSFIMRIRDSLSKYYIDWELENKEIDISRHGAIDDAINHMNFELNN